MKKELRKLLFERNGDGVFDEQDNILLGEFDSEVESTSESDLCLDELKDSELLFYSQLKHKQYVREQLRGIRSGVSVIKVIMVIYFIAALLLALLYIMQ